MVSAAGFEPATHALKGGADCVDPSAAGCYWAERDLIEAALLNSSPREEAMCQPLRSEKKK